MQRLRAEVDVTVDDFIPCDKRAHARGEARNGFLFSGGLWIAHLLIRDKAENGPLKGWRWFNSVFYSPPETRYDLCSPGSRERKGAIRSAGVVALKSRFSVELFEK